MEHRFSLLRILIPATTLFILSISLTACHKPLPEPEVLDLIYQDLRAEEEKAKKTIEEITKAIEESEKEIEKLPVADPVRKVTIRKLTGTREQLAKAKQTAEYYGIRAESRKAYSRDAYTRVFNTPGEKDWPSKDEFALYRKEKEFRSRSLHWGTHVPKSSFVTGPQPAAKPAAESKHAPAGH